jgi:pyruvate/2-oxoglutarate/acetoin dehydrogenase E1 component
LPIVAGKPEAPIFLKAAQRLGCENAHETVLVIGDRLDTDIAGGVKVGMKTALVLTGIDQAKQVLAASKDSRPDYILGDLRELFEPYPQPVRHNDGSVSVRKAKVKKVGKEIVIVSSGANKRDLLRATAQLIWDSGLAIYGFSVPEKIYS